MATVGLSSVFSFTHLTLSLNSAWISSSMGAIIWHGPHPGPVIVCASWARGLRGIEVHRTEQFACESVLWLLGKCVRLVMGSACVCMCANSVVGDGLCTHPAGPTPQQKRVTTQINSSLCLGEGWAREVGNGGDSFWTSTHRGPRSLRGLAPAGSSRHRQAGVRL